MEYWVIDRWEGPVAICQNEQGIRKEIPKERFPEGTKEGDYFRFLEDGSLEISSEETKKRRNNARNLRKCLLLR